LINVYDGDTNGNLLINVYDGDTNGRGRKLKIFLQTRQATRQNVLTLSVIVLRSSAPV